MIVALAIAIAIAIGFWHLKLLRQNRHRCGNAARAAPRRLIPAKDGLKPVSAKISRPLKADLDLDLDVDLDVDLDLDWDLPMSDTSSTAS